jgi:hypothetical protein
MPIDPQPRKGGNIRLETIGRTRYAVVDPEGLYVSHFATCPNREQHRIRPSSPAASKTVTPVPDAAGGDGPAQLTLEDLD